MSKDSKEVYNAQGKSNLLMFDPETLKLVEDTNHPLYDERVHLPVSESMVLNIMANGVIQPISVRKNPETGDTEVVVGRQRVKACREANRRLTAQGLKPYQIPAVVKRGEGATLASTVVSENEIREDDTALGRCKKAARLLHLGQTEAQISVAFGCSTQTVKNMIAVLECTKAVRDAVENKQIPISEAYKLAKLGPEEQRETVTKMIEAAGTANTARGRVRKMREVSGNGPSVRGKREINALREKIEAKCGDPNFSVVALAVLKWVLGGKEPSFARLTKDQKAALEAAKETVAA